MSTPFQSKPPPQQIERRIIPFNPPLANPDLAEEDSVREEQNLRRLSRRKGASLLVYMLGGVALMAFAAALVWVALPAVSRLQQASPAIAPITSRSETPAVIARDTQAATPAPVSQAPVLPSPVLPQPAPVTSAPVAAPQAALPQPAAPAVSVPAVSAPPVSAPPVATVRLRLSEEEVGLLIERARRLIREQRDVTAARPFLIRAEQGGSARAAFLLAETFDPAMLESWNMRSVRPDVPRARALYGRALDGGIGEARARMERLPN